MVRETHNRYDAYPTREFVPILVEDAAHDRLHAIGNASLRAVKGLGQSTSDMPMVMTVIGSMISARNDTMLSRSQPSDGPAGNRSSSPIRAPRRSGVARQLWLMWSYLARTAVTLTDYS